MDILEKEKFNKAFQLHSDGILDKAETVYNEILGENPKNAEVLNLLGVLKLSQNKLEEAETFITKALSIKKDAYFYENLAKVYEAKKDVTKEIEILEEARILKEAEEPGWPEAEVNCTPVAFPCNKSWKETDCPVSGAWKGPRRCAPPGPA